MRIARICTAFMLLLAAVAARGGKYFFAVEDEGKMYSLTYDGSKVDVWEGSELLLSSGNIRAKALSVEVIAFLDKSGTQVASVEMPCCTTDISWLELPKIPGKDDSFDFYLDRLSCYNSGQPDKNQKAFIKEFYRLYEAITGKKLKTAAFAPEKKPYPSYSSSGKSSSKSAATKSATTKNTPAKSTASKTAVPKPAAALPKDFSNGGYVISPVTISIKTNRSDSRKYISVGATVTTPSSGFTYIYYFLDQRGMPLSVPKELKLSSDLRQCVTYIDGKRTVAQKIRGAYKAHKAAVGGLMIYVDALSLCTPAPTGIYCIVDLYDDSMMLKARRISPYLQLP